MSTPAASDAAVIRRADREMAARISALIHESFTTLAAADWVQHARDRFIEESSPERLAEAIRTSAFSAVEVAGVELRGVVLMRRATSLDLLFVRPSCIRQGVARRLWGAARRHVEASFPDVVQVELNTTPYALPAYRALGFVAISEEFERDGCRATRMAFPLGRCPMIP